MQGESEKVREIKFRVWSKEEKKYIDEIRHIGLVLSLDGNICMNEYGGMIGTSKLGLTLEQYTGLKDKNGVEIYENDIVNVVDCRFSNNFEGVVEYDNCSFYVNEEDCISHYRWIDFQDIEVIGTVHDDEQLHE